MPLHQLSSSTEQLLNHLIVKQSFLKNYPSIINLKEMKNPKMPQAINLYNHGYPAEWPINAYEKKQNDFKVFSTGDAFSILSPQVDARCSREHSCGY